MHSCPECGQACDCGGDIDDVVDEDVIACEHLCGPEMDDLEDLGISEFEDDVQPRCRMCGCTEDRACEGGCVWATADLCSRCVAVAQ